MTWFWVALGSALGGVGRYGCTALIEARLSDGFPWGTLTVNVVGSSVIGLVAAMNISAGRLLAVDDARLFLMVGVLGGFTTFSSFSLQSLALLQDGRWAAASAYVAASVMLCLLGVWAGLTAGEWLNR